MQLTRSGEKRILLLLRAAPPAELGAGGGAARRKQSQQEARVGRPPHPRARGWRPGTKGLGARGYGAAAPASPGARGEETGGRGRRTSQAPSSRDARRPGSRLRLPGGPRGDGAGARQAGGPGGDGAGASRRGLRGRRGLAARAALKRGTLPPRTLRAPGPGSYRAAPPRLLAGSVLGPGGELARWRGPNPLSPASGQQPTPRRRSPGPPSLPRGPRPQPAPCPSHTAAEDCAGAAQAPPTSAPAQASAAQPTRLASLPALDRAGPVPSGRPQNASGRQCACVRLPARALAGGCSWRMYWALPSDVLTLHHPKGST